MTVRLDFVTVTAKAGKQNPAYLPALILSFYAVWRLHNMRDRPEKAIYSAYAAMKCLFAYTDEMLIRFYPICSYDVKEPENPRWYIVFDPVEKVQGYYYFSVFVDAKDGRVLMVTDNTGDAVG